MSLLTSVTDLTTDVSSGVTLSLAYVRLIRNDPNDKHKLIANSSLYMSTRLELSIHISPRGFNRTGGMTG
ncbi:cystathionine gamma [Fusarium sp. NRRL 25303]|nr:cystathionine gamma [Fusarium sp. NRRL 25303]